MQVFRSIHVSGKNDYYSKPEVRGFGWEFPYFLPHFGVTFVEVFYTLTPLGFGGFPGVDVWPVGKKIGQNPKDKK